MNHYHESPQVLNDFLSYIQTIKGSSPKTVKEYYLDLRMFFRYIKQKRGEVDDIPFDEIPIKDIDIAYIKTITLSDAYDFLMYTVQDRPKHMNSDNSEIGLMAASRARKVSALRSFFKYLTDKAHLLDHNPIQNLEYPSVRRSLPKYLSMEESVELLESVDGPFKERDYCILMLFLNCGIRRSELVGLNLTDVYEDRIRVVGKGNKERIVYMGSSCRKAIDRYLEERNQIVLTDNKALFGSRDKNRISVSAVHRLVKKHLLESGLDASQFSAHKLRHTAATLMLANGVDLKTLQEVLGHENLNTTQIYTHIENTDKKIAAEANPLSKLKL